MGGLYGPTFEPGLGRCDIDAGMISHNVTQMGNEPILQSGTIRVGLRACLSFSNHHGLSV
jgi:hypothetical protein